MTEGQNLVPALLWRMRKVEEMRACEAWADVDVGLHTILSQEGSRGFGGGAVLRFWTG